MKKINNEEITCFFASAEKDYTKIFNTLLDEKVLFPQKAILLSRKLGLTSYNYYNYIDDLEEQLAKLKKKGKIKFWVSNTFLILFFILFMFTGLSLTYFGILFFCASSYGGKKQEKDAINTYNEVEKNKKELATLIENCNRLLDSKTSIYYENSKKINNKENQEILNLLSANKYIQIYLENDFLPDVDIDVQNVMIRILQDELKTKENYLDVLLKMAKEKISFENLRKESELTRVLDKSNKK